MNERSDTRKGEAEMKEKRGGYRRSEVSVKIAADTLKQLLEIKQRYEQEEGRPLTVAEIIRRLIEKEVVE
jgi:hypothetical protein